MPCSSTTARRLSCAARLAAIIPAMPPPTMTTSYCALSFISAVPCYFIPHLLQARRLRYLFPPSTGFDPRHANKLRGFLDFLFDKGREFIGFVADGLHTIAGEALFYV